MPSKPGQTGLILSVTGIACILPVFIHILISYQKHSIKLKRFDTISTIICFICYLCYSSFYVVLSIHGIQYSDTQKFHPSDCIGLWWISPLFGLGRLFSTNFFVVRLYKTFQGTSFAVSSTAYLLSIILLSLSMLCVTLLFSSSTLMPSYCILSSPHSMEVQAIHSYADCDTFLSDFSLHRQAVKIAAISLNTITEMTANIILVRLYLKKFILLSMAHNQIRTAVESQTIDKKKSYILKQNALFLELAEKTTMIVILLSCGYVVPFIISGAQVGQHWMVIDNVIRSCCIYMAYTCGKRMYAIICFKARFCFEFWESCCFCCCKVQIVPKLRIIPSVTDTHQKGIEPQTNDETEHEKELNVLSLKQMNTATELVLFVDDNLCNDVLSMTISNDQESATSCKI